MNARLPAALVALVMCAATSVAPAQVSSGSSPYVDHSLVFLGSAHGLPAADRDHIRRALHLLVEQLKVPEGELPHILVIEASPTAAHAAGVEESCVRRAHRSEREVYFELWIVSGADDYTYVWGLYTVLDRHFALNSDREKKKEVVARVTRYLQNTVSAHSREKP